MEFLVSDKKVQTIESLEEGFSELQNYSDAQFRLVIQLKTDIARLESENKSLKNMLESNITKLDFNVLDLGIGIGNEQLICETQILMLKDLAVTRQLTMEEAKKLQIFTDVLLKYKKPTKEDPYSVEKMSPAELLKIVSGVN